MKRTLGLDLGTNSIGWSLINEQQIIGLGSRIIPMTQDTISDFNKGVSKTQTSERTRMRGVRRLLERKLQRRERLHRVLNILGYLPAHYASEIDFVRHKGQFKPETEPKLAYLKTESGKHHFLFENSFQEMVAEFKAVHPELLQGEDGKAKKLPQDWTVYYLRKKALTQPIEKEELAWLLLLFNQKRGYYQLRGEEMIDLTKRVEYFALRVESIEALEKNRKGETEYLIRYENGMEQKKLSREPLDWEGQVKELIVTTSLNEDGSDKYSKEGEIQRSFRVPKEEDWTLLKKKSEHDIEQSGKTVGTYIYDSLLQNPSIKIIGQFVRTIERKYYRDELRQIIQKQLEFHPELQDETYYDRAITELYPNNDIHRETIRKRSFLYLLMEDIIFYQRPLKSKKSTIGSCRYEMRYAKNKDGATFAKSLSCIPKSNPYFEEIRLWGFLKNLRIYKREEMIDNKRHVDFDVTHTLLPDEQAWGDLYTWLSIRKEISQKELLNFEGFNLKKSAAEYRWNFVEDKSYPCSPTRALILDRIAKCNPLAQIEKKHRSALFATIVSPASVAQKHVVIDKLLQKLKLDAALLHALTPFLDWRPFEQNLWHLLYSVESTEEIEKALHKLASRLEMGSDFATQFLQAPPFEKSYGAYSEKAIKKLLSLMRRGSYRQHEVIPVSVEDRLLGIEERLQSIGFEKARVAEVADDDYNKPLLSTFCPKVNLNEGLNLTQACYAIYGRFAEEGEINCWRHPSDIAAFLKEFKQHSLRNPIVEQVVTETLRVVHDIWEIHGNSMPNFFSEIHLELGREMKNPADKRKQITDQVTQNENTNLRLRALLMEMMHDNSIECVRSSSPFQLDLLKIYEEDVLSANRGALPEDIAKIARMPQPTKGELTRYKLWLDQKYQSPYTGEMIPLAKLFTPAYQIEHIIPQSVYFDNSLSNKVICEASINKEKSNQLGMTFIMEHAGRIIPDGYGRTLKVLTVEAYTTLVNKRFVGNKSKLQKLLMTEVPESFIARQLNDTRYISRYISGLLSNIVREEKEMESNSKHLIQCNGAVTSRLKQDWGLNEIWNRIVTPRFERLNHMTDSDSYGQWVNQEGKRYFQSSVPFDQLRGFNKKRIDHRHHALDALVVACATRNHINYLNNQSGKGRARNDLKQLLCHKHKQDALGNYSWIFNKPWEEFTQQCYDALANTIVSIKSNTRVITKAVNYTQQWVVLQDGTKVKRVVSQSSGDGWAIRKSLHKDTVMAEVKLRGKKTVALAKGLADWENLVDKQLKRYIANLVKMNYTAALLTKHFKDRKNIFEGRDIAKVELYLFESASASRKALSSITSAKQLESVTDSGIRKILMRHLASERCKGSYEAAFSPEGVEQLNAHIRELNNGTPHQPIYKVRLSEPMGMKYPVGATGNKSKKFVEADKGTNLFFAIYADAQGKRSFDTIGLNIVVERLKQNLPPVPETNEKGDALLFYLSPNDLVYVPSEEEMASGRVIGLEEMRRNSTKIYKVVSFSTTRIKCIPVTIAAPIVSTDQLKELGNGNKSERAWSCDITKAWSTDMIKQHCIKLKVNRLGELK